MELLASLKGIHAAGFSLMKPDAEVRFFCTILCEILFFQPINRFIHTPTQREKNLAIWRFIWDWMCHKYASNRQAPCRIQLN